MVTCCCKDSLPYVFFIIIMAFLLLGLKYSYSLVNKIMKLEGLLCPVVLEVTKSIKVALGQDYMKNPAVWVFITCSNKIICCEIGFLHFLRQYYQLSQF